MGNSQTTVSNVRTREAESRLESRKFLRILGGLFFAVPNESWNSCLNDSTQCTPIGNPIAQTYQLHLKDGTAIVRIIDPDDLFSAASAQQCECPPPPDWHFKVILQVVHFAAPGDHGPTKENRTLPNNNCSPQDDYAADELAKDLDIVEGGEDPPCDVRVSIGSTPATSPLEQRQQAKQEATHLEPDGPEGDGEDGDEGDEDVEDEDNMEEHHDDSARGSSWMTRLFPQIFTGHGGRASLAPTGDDESVDSPLLRTHRDKHFTQYESASSGTQREDGGQPEGDDDDPSGEEDQDDECPPEQQNWRGRPAAAVIVSDADRTEESVSEHLEMTRSAHLEEVGSDSEEEEEPLEVESVAPGGWSQPPSQQQRDSRPAVHPLQTSSLRPSRQKRLLQPPILEESPVVRPILPAHKGGPPAPLSERTTRSAISSSPPPMPKPDTILLRVSGATTRAPLAETVVEPVLMPPPKHEWLNHLDRFVPAEEEAGSSPNATDGEEEEDDSSSSSSSSPSPPPSKQKRRRMNQWSKFDLGSAGEESDGGNAEEEQPPPPPPSEQSSTINRKPKKVAPVPPRSPTAAGKGAAMTVTAPRSRRGPTSAARKAVPSRSRKVGATPMSTTPPPSCSTTGRRRRRGAAAN